MAHGRIYNFFRRFRAGDPVNAIANLRDQDCMRNFIEGLHGIGCRVYKDTDGSLRNCRIIVDGSSDEESGETAEMAEARAQSMRAFVLPAGTGENQYLHWNTEDQDWEVVETVSVSPVTSVQYDETTHKLQLKKTAVRCLVVGTEDASWTDITTATAHADEPHDDFFS